MNTDTAVQETMNETVRGLILRQTDYKDHDALISVVSKEYGKITLVAKGIRKASSKNAGKLLPYTKAEFLIDYKEGKTIFTLKNVSVLSVYFDLHQSLESQTCASVLCEVALSMLLEGRESGIYEEVYDDLEKCFSLLNEGKHTNTILSLFLVDILRLSGIAPQVDGCVRCSNTKVSSISVKDGGFLCADCAGNASLWDTVDLKRFRLLVKGGLEHFDVISDTAPAEAKDVKILVEILREHAGIPVRSYNLFERLFSH